jgi:hypothetical protein
MDGLIEWHFAGTGGIQLFRDAERAGSASLTLATDDLESYAAAVAGRGIHIGAITTGERARFVVVTDPEDNAITLAGLLGAGD